MTAANKKRVAVLGVTGMLGFAVGRVLHADGHVVMGLCRKEPPAEMKSLLDFSVLSGVEFTDIVGVEMALGEFAPDVVINCAADTTGANDGDPDALFRINALFPRQLEILTARSGAFLVHVSTDSVFDGATPPHSEASVPVPLDLYALSKYLGETSGGNALTIRTSMIGRSLAGRKTFANWALSTNEPVIEGYSNAIFTGLPVNIIAEFLRDHVVGRETPPSGVLHLASEPIDKYRLLQLLLSAWGRDDLVVRENDGPQPDRSLTSTRMHDIMDIPFPIWPEMIASMRRFYADFGL
jgi:dTDP-4-dehydrorhamnose reductase